MQLCGPKQLWFFLCNQKEKGECVPFYRLNLADLYNQKMGQVDVGDQLRNYYRFDHWMRKRKWWWSIWVWCAGMLLTNAYIIYSKYCKVHKIKQKYNHYEFICKVAEAWLHPDPFFAKDINSYSVGSSVTTSIFPSDFTLDSNISKERRKWRKCRIIKDLTDLKRPTQVGFWCRHLPVMAETENPPRCQISEGKQR